MLHFIVVSRENLNGRDVGSHACWKVWVPWPRISMKEFALLYIRMARNNCLVIYPA